MIELLRVGLERRENVSHDLELLEERQMTTSAFTIEMTSTCGDNEMLTDETHLLLFFACCRPRESVAQRRELLIECDASRVDVGDARLRLLERAGRRVQDD